MRGIREIFEQKESGVVDLIAALGPWLTPIPSADLVGRATVRHLGWSPWMGLVSGAIIECLGITSITMALTLWNYNRARRKSDPQAPFGLAVGLALVYLLATIGLTVLLDIVPELARFAPALFPLLALVGSVNLGLRADHRRRLDDIRVLKERRRAERAEAAAGRERQLSGKFPASSWKELQAAERERLLTLTVPEIAGMYPVSERTARNWKKRLKNGNGK